MKESAPKMRASSASKVIMVSVLRLVAVFSTMEKGCPGFTSVILKNVDPKSKPITTAWAIEANMARLTAKKSRPRLNLL